MRSPGALRQAHVSQPYRPLHCRDENAEGSCMAGKIIYVKNLGCLKVLQLLLSSHCNFCYWFLGPSSVTFAMEENGIVKYDCLILAPCLEVWGIAYILRHPNYRGWSSLQLNLQTDSFQALWIQDKKTFIQQVNREDGGPLSTVLNGIVLCLHYRVYGLRMFSFCLFWK